jgi:hypothetical protein
MGMWVNTLAGKNVAKGYTHHGGPMCSSIRALIDDRTRAVCAKESVRATSGIAPEIFTFDVVNPLQNIGWDASRKRVEEWSGSLQPSVRQDWQDLLAKQMYP